MKRPSWRAPAMISVLTAVFVLPASASSLRAAAQLAAATGITSVSVAGDGDLTAVVVQGDGPLPEPSAGAVDGPPRIFFDFPGVLPKTRGTAAAASPSVRRVRVALHSSVPRVTRVVIDLVDEIPFQIDRSGLAAGRLTVRIGRNAALQPAPDHLPVVQIPPAAAQPAPDRPPVPPSQVPPVPSPPSGSSAPPRAGRPGSGTVSPPAQTVAPPQPFEPADRPLQPVPSTGTTPPPPAAADRASPPRRGGDRYRQQVDDALDRARSLRPVLSAIDRLAPQEPEVLDRAAEEFDSLRRRLSAVKAPEAIRATHDLIVRACTLGAIAAGLRGEAIRSRDETASRNAASAAAGALLLLDRACVELGCTPRLDLP